MEAAIPPATTKDQKDLVKRILKSTPTSSCTFERTFGSASTTGVCGRDFRPTSQRLEPSTSLCSNPSCAARAQFCAT